MFLKSGMPQGTSSVQQVTLRIIIIPMKAMVVISEMTLRLRDLCARL